MNLDTVFKGIVEDLKNPVCFVSLDHTITYLNKSALERYAHRGGEKLIGKSIFDCHNENSKKLTLEYFDRLLNDDNLTEIFMGYNKKHDENNYIIAVRDENKKLMGYYERHESCKQE